ncbi:sarcosine oxidase [Halorubrum sp. 48-1-W]|uniref:NAD(P)/FAD-dependent oxidoreductase n=1 Tax=Halorubrum sp. 48-1-W TaxID=2249761 RepID=UPI000DCCDFC4|nr:FAD-dependent oxidoreductase [Halorubrum sp. 48-1-W]RAW44924.1 sarcosine oxidase [Halorubrum sp. 48-1-W]
MTDSNPSDGVEPSDPAVAVVGGGAVGVTAAHDLAARGATVTLFERDDLASGASGRAAGVLYDAYAEDVDAAIGARAMERFRRFDRTLPGFEFTPCPYVIAVREGDEDAEAVPGMVDRMREHGRDVSVVDPDDLGERFPLSTSDLAAAAVGEGAGWADPGSYVVALGERAVREGVTVETDTEVELVADAGATLRVDGTEQAFDAVVVAVGAHTERFLEAGGIAVPVKPYRVQALTSRVPYDGPMTYDATAGVYFRPHPTGLLAGDGTEPFEADPDAYDSEGDDWFVENVSTALRERADYDPEVERAWAGVCTATPDKDPLLGPVADDVFVAAGWQGHGFMRAPATGEILAEGVLASLSGTAIGDDDSPWVEAFDPGRFEGDEEFEIEEGMSVRNR